MTKDDSQVVCRNNSGVKLERGMPVMVTGAIGAHGRLTIAPMDASDAANIPSFLGVAAHDILDGADGSVTAFGDVRSIDTSAWDDGDLLWCDPATAGGLTATKPGSGAALQVGYVARAHAEAGVLQVRSVPTPANTVTTSVDPVTGVIENLGADSSIGLRGVPYVSGVTEANSRKWRRMLARVQNGIARGRLLLIGDSTTMGAGSGTSTVGCAGAYTNSYPHKLADRLTAKGCRASHKSMLGDQRTTVGVPIAYTTYDPRAAFGTGWAPGLAGTLGGTGFSFSGASAGTFSLTDTITNFEVYHAQSISSGTMTVSVDSGGSLGTLSSVGGAVVVKTAFSAGASGSHTIKLNAAGNGNMFVPGVIAWDATKTEIDILQGAYFGATSAAFTPNSDAWDALKMAAAYTPDVSIVQLGINDCRTGVSIATFTKNIATIVTALLAAGSDVILMDFLPDSLKGYTAQKPYIDAIKAVAASKGVPFTSVSARFGNDFSVGVSLGLCFDAVHLKDVGYAMEADWLANVILSV